MQDYIYPFCFQSALKFYKERDFHMLDLLIHNKYETTGYQNKHPHHLYVYRKDHCQTSVAHLNTYSLSSSFNEFSYTMNKYKFHYVTLSKKWLKDNKTQLDYIQIDGYISEFKKRDLRCQGRAGF